MSWETVIGLEIHVQLSTKSKLFSGGSTEFGAESNTHVDLIDMGLPGVLPVANKEAFIKPYDLVSLQEQILIKHHHLIEKITFTLTYQKVIK